MNVIPARKAVEKARKLWKSGLVDREVAARMGWRFQYAFCVRTYYLRMAPNRKHRKRKKRP